MKFVKPGWLAIPEMLRNLATPDTMKTIGIATLPIAKAISPMILLHVVAARRRHSPSQSHEPREPHGDSLSGFNGECCDWPISGVGGRLSLFVKPEQLQPDRMSASATQRRCPPWTRAFAAEGRPAVGGSQSAPSLTLCVKTPQARERLELLFPDRPKAIAHDDLRSEI